MTEQRLAELKALLERAHPYPDGLLDSPLSSEEAGPGVLEVAMLREGISACLGSAADFTEEDVLYLVGLCLPGEPKDK